MKTEIGIWRIDGESREGTRLDLAGRVETEEMLEDVVVANPDMLMSGLTLVGRQLQVATGNLDLLGIDADGRLVVFELKRDKLTRKAVAQILDYCSYLETLSDGQLATLIAERSGQGGINNIADFDEWYANQPGDSLRPVRMVLIGLGIDAGAERMVAYLAERGIDIGLVTFHGYTHGDSTLLARQVRTAEDSPGSFPGRPGMDELIRKAREHGVAEIWQDAQQSLTVGYRTEFTKSGITYKQRTITLPDDVSVRASHSISIDEHGTVRLTLYPAAVDLCHDAFEKLKREIPFNAEKPPNAPQTQRAPNQWYTRLDATSWQGCKSRLIEFVRDVEDAWRKHERSAFDESAGGSDLAGAMTDCATPRSFAETGAITDVRT